MTGLSKFYSWVQFAKDFSFHFCITTEEAPSSLLHTLRIHYNLLCKFIPSSSYIEVQWTKVWLQKHSVNMWHVNRWSWRKLWRSIFIRDLNIFQCDRFIIQCLVIIWWMVKLFCASWRIFVKSVKRWWRRIAWNKSINYTDRHSRINPSLPSEDRGNTVSFKVSHSVNGPKFAYKRIKV